MFCDANIILDMTSTVFDKIINIQTYHTFKLTYINV